MTCFICGGDHRGPHFPNHWAGLSEEEKHRLEERYSEEETRRCYQNYLDQLAYTHAQVNPR